MSARARRLQLLPLLGAVGAVGVVGVVGCRVDRVAIDVDAKAVSARATSLRATAFADDGQGCDGQRFIASPKLTAIDSVEVALSSVNGGVALALPRLGDKLIVIDANDDDGLSLARGCAELGVVDGIVDVSVKLAPTTRAESVVAGTVVVDADSDDAIGVAVFADDGDAGSAGNAVFAEVVAPFDVVVQDDVVSVDDDGVARLRPALPAMGPVLVRFIPERPQRDEAVTISAFVRPAPTPVFVGLGLNSPVLVPVGGDVIVVSVDRGDDGQSLQSRRFADDGQSPTRLLTPAPSVRFLGAFGDTDNGTEGRAEDNAFALAVVGGPGGDEIVALDLSQDAVNTVVARHPLPGSAAGLRAVAVGDCARGPLASPVLLRADDGGAVFIEVAFGAVVVVPIDDVDGAALPAPLLSGCVSAADGDVARVIFGAVTDAPAEVEAGGRGGVKDIAFARDATFAALTLPPQVIQVSVREDGKAIIARVDAGQVLLAPHQLADGVLVDVTDVNDDPARLLPSAPLFVTQGLIFSANDGDGVAQDTLAILDLGTEADPNASAVFGVAGVLGSTQSSGVDGLCAPASACAGSVAVDLDGDGRLELVTFGERPDGVGVDVYRFSPAVSRSSATATNRR